MANKIEEKKQPGQPLIMPEPREQDKMLGVRGEPKAGEPPPVETTLGEKGPAPSTPEGPAEIKEAPEEPPERIPAAIPTEEKTETTQFWAGNKSDGKKIGEIVEAASGPPEGLEEKIYGE